MKLKILFFIRPHPNSEIKNLSILISIVSEIILVMLNRVILLKLQKIDSVTYLMFSITTDENNKTIFDNMTRRTC